MPWSWWGGWAMGGRQLWHPDTSVPRADPPPPRCPMLGPARPPSVMPTST